MHLVWILIVTGSDYAGFATQLGPFQSKDDCQRVAAVIEKSDKSNKFNPLTCLQTSAKGADQ